MRSMSSERSAVLVWLSVLKQDIHAHAKSNRKSEQCGARAKLWLNQVSTQARVRFYPKPREEATVNESMAK